MAWSTPPTFSSGQIVTANDLNSYLRDNPNYLLGGKPITKVLRVGTADYQTTSSTFVDVDSSNLILSMNINSGRAIILCEFKFRVDNTASSNGELDVILDSTTRAGDTTHGLIRIPQNTVVAPITLVASFSNLSAGSHTFKLQYRNVTAGAISEVANNGYPVTMLGWEA